MAKQLSGLNLLAQYIEGSELVTMIDKFLVGVIAIYPWT